MMGDAAERAAAELAPFPVNARVPGAPASRDSIDAVDRGALARVADGELDALAGLYDRYRTVAYSIALRVTADATLAEDVLQDAFLGAWRHAGRYTEGRGSVKTWLLAIVHHRAVDAVRRRRPTTALPEREDPQPAVLTAPDLWAEVAAGLDAGIVRAALAALPEAQRGAIELAYFGGLTQQEIATATDTPLGTVKGRMRLGLGGMRRSLIASGSAEAWAARGPDHRWASDVPATPAGHVCAERGWRHSGRVGSTRFSDIRPPRVRGAGRATRARRSDVRESIDAARTEAGNYSRPAGSHATYPEPYA